MSAVQGPRPVKVILGDALAELRAREQRLAGALAECRAAIKAFEAATQAHATERVPVPAEENDGTPVKLVRQPSAAPTSDKERDELIRKVVGEKQPCPMRVLVADSGLTVGMLQPAIQRLRDAGELQRVGDRAAARYWLTADLDRYVAEHDGHLPTTASAA